MLKESMLRPCSALCSVCINATLDFKFLHITDMKVAFWKVLPAFLYVLLPALPVQVINKLCEDCWWNKLSQTSHKKTEGTLVFSPLQLKHIQTQSAGFYKRGVWNLWVEKLWPLFSALPLVLLRSHNSATFIHMTPSPLFQPWAVSIHQIQDQLDLHLLL